MNRNETKVSLLCIAALVGGSCIIRPPHSRPQANQPADQPAISLHGFLGEDGFVSLARMLLPPTAEESPLPGSWARDIPALNYRNSQRPLYVDGLDDDNPQLGIESSTLTFFAGHGQDIDEWLVPPNDEVVSLGSVHVGDVSLRYFWLYSCQVLAHGPMKIEGGRNYSAPQCFHPGRGDADVFGRWTRAFASKMRMVCGGSTNLGHSDVGEIWNYLLEAETSVADAWILGLANPKEAPVCLARGGRDRLSSALSDRTLHPEGVPQPDWMHLQYPIRCEVERNGPTLRVICNKSAICGASSEPPPSLEPAVLPETAPLVTATILQAPSFTDNKRSLGFVRLAGHEGWKFHPDSGAVVLAKGRDQYSQELPCASETEWTFQPTELLQRTGLDLQVLATDSAAPAAGKRLADLEITALEMRVESRRDGAESGSCAVRSLFLLLHSKVDVGPASHPISYPVFGPAIALELQRRGDEEPVLASFSAPRRNLTVKPAKVSLKPVLAVINEAHQELQLNSDEYPVGNARATFGYEEAPLRCQQQSLRPTYEIQFFPTPKAALDRPTVIVRRDARLDSHDASWKCQVWGEFPPP
jgi:hypothetical protein